MFPANRVENGVDSTRGKLAEAIYEIFRAVVNGRATERGDKFLFGFGSRTEQLQPGDLAQLESAGTHSSRGRMNQNSLPFAELRHAMEHLERGHVIEDQADSFCGVEPLRNAHEASGGYHSVAAVSA